MQKLTVKAAGLYTYPNPLSQVPPGSLLTADNVVIDREGIIEPRRGFNVVSGTLGNGVSNRSAQLVSFGNFVLSHYGPLGAPTTMAFYAEPVTITGKVTSGSNIITNLTSISGLYPNQFISQDIETQQFNADVLTGTNTLLNVVSDVGIIVGYGIGGFGIPLNTTISSISGTGPYIITMSSNATATGQGLIFTATNQNLLSFPANTTITAVSTNSITVSANATQTSRSQTFAPSDVTTGTSGTIAIINHGFTDGQSLQFTSTVTLPGGLTVGTEYLANNVVPNSFSLTDVNDNPITITSQGTGTHTVIQRAFLDSAGWIDYSGTLNQPDSSTKVRSIQTSGNLYVTSSQGIQKLDNITGGFVNAGAPDGLDGTAILNPGPTGFMTPNTQVAYRVVWGYKDANNNLILGVPSQRIILANTTVQSKNVDISITIPSTVTTAYFFQVYRSGFSSDSNTQPNDEMALVYEANPDSTDITNRFVTFTDETPESLRTGAALYTSPSQQGITQANNQPPFAKDVTFFKGSTFYSNTKTKQNFQLSLLAVSGTYSILGDTTNVSGDTPTTLANLTSSVTANTTSGSNILTSVSSTANLTVGQQIADDAGNTVIPSGTTITSIGSAAITISNNALSSVTTQTIVLTVTGLFTGQIVSGTGIPSGTQVVQVYTPFTTTATIPASSDPNPDTLVLVSNIAAFLVGQPIAGTGIPTNTVVASIDIANSKVVLSKTSTNGSAQVGATITAGNGVQLSQAATSVNSQEVINFQNGTGGIKIGDVITIAGTSYTAAATEDISAKNFKIYAQGSPAQNINDTSLSLIRVINQTSAPTPTVYAYYLSASNTLPGQILFQERIFGGGTFFLTSSADGASFSPNLPTSGTTIASTNDVFVNGLYYSKTQQPEAVPTLNFTQVGSSNSAILRVIPLRDSLFILKDEGIYRLTGTDPTNFTIDLFDSTTKIKSAESAVSLNNVIFMLSEYGVVTVSDTGVTVVSRAIEDKFLTLFEQSSTKAANLTFGISYETERKYIIFCITNAADVTPTQAFVYNTFTNTWTRWILNQTSGIVHPQLDLLFLGNANDNTVNEERKLRTYTDYVDTSSDVNIISYSGNQITIDNTTGVEVGSVLWQTPGRFSLVTAINLNTSVITVKDTISSWVLGNAAMLGGISSTIEYVPMTADNPGAMKQFRETTCVFLTPQFNHLTVGFSTDLSLGEETITLQGQYGLLWGLFQWGNVPWGGTVTPIPLRTYVPLQKQRCSQLNLSISHNEAYAFYRLTGVSFIHNDLSERVGI